MKKNKIPPIHFKRFTEAWEQREFGEIFKYERPDKYIVSNDKYNDSYKTPVLTANKGFILGYTDEVNTYDKDSIIFDDFTLDNKYVDFPYMVKSSAIKILTLKDEEIDNLRFAFERLNSTKIETMGHARHYISVVQSTKTLVPNINEQTHIGNFFRILDNLIDLNKSKYDKLINIKKSMLEKMLPKEGKCTPEIRFNGFTEPWKLYKLEELSEPLEYGLNAAATKFDGENKYLRITDIDEQTRKFLYDDLTSPDTNIDNADKFKLQNGDIVFARTGASVGKTYIYDDSDNRVYYAGFLIRARIKSGYSADFIFQNTLTDRYKKYIYITSQRSGQPGVNAQEYSEFNLMVPTYEEQIKIGEYFKNIDKLINLKQQELEKLKNIKKSLLEKMFI